MDPREAFRVFIRFQLRQAVEEGDVILSDEQIEKFANGIEDDPTFYEKMNIFLNEYLFDYGDNYDLWED